MMRKESGYYKQQRQAVRFGFQSDCRCSIRQAGWLCSCRHRAHPPSAAAPGPVRRGTHRAGTRTELKRRAGRWGFGLVSVLLKWGISPQGLRFPREMRAHSISIAPTAAVPAVPRGPRCPTGRPGPAGSLLSPFHGAGPERRFRLADSAPCRAAPDSSAAGRRPGDRDTGCPHQNRSRGHARPAGWHRGQPAPGVPLCGSWTGWTQEHRQDSLPQEKKPSDSST